MSNQNENLDNQGDLEHDFDEQIENDIIEQQSIEHNQAQPQQDEEVLVNDDVGNENDEYLDADEYEDEEFDEEDEEDENDEDEDEEEDLRIERLLDNLVADIQETSDTDDYELVSRPNNINFDTALPASHNYLGENFQDISAPKVIHEVNDNLTIPLLALPGHQLLPGQIIPLLIYSPLQISMIRKRIENTDGDSTIGFIIRPEQDLKNGMIGILAEILSSKNEEELDTMGLLLKVKGRERFKILKFKRDITGCIIADVKILSEYILYKNPLKIHSNTRCNYIYDLYFKKKSPVSHSKAEFLNTLPHPAWLYRQYDCSYIIDLILHELNQSYDNTQLPTLEKIPVEPKLFSNWLLSNLPFDDQLRINILKLDCINQRLRFIYSVLKNYTSINCRICRTQICLKSDVFSMCVQGFMGAYVNPSGQIHETLTVYKAKNLNLIGRSSTDYSWFPGYAWTICQCKKCGSHIGWKFNATNSQLTPDKFWGLTRKAVTQTNDSLENKKQTISNESTSILNQNEQQQIWLPIL